MKNLLRFLPLLILTALSALGSVSSQTARIAYTITSLPAACPTTFPFNSTATVPDLVVLDGGSGNASNSPPVTLTLNSDYTVTGGGYNSQNQLQTGTVTILGTGTHAVQVGDVITILRNVPFTQTTTFSSSGFMSPLMIESGLDKLTLQTQQLKDLFGLSLQFQKNEILSPLLGLSARESQTLGFNASGAIEYGAGGGGGGTTYFAGTGLLLSANTFSILAAQPTITSLGTLTSLAASGQITSTVATGTAPLVVASTTNVPNLNASSLGGATFASPGPIGGTTPGLASFTTVSGSAGNFSNSVLVGSLRMFLSQIENYTANSTAAIAMNYDGYNSSFTQFRDINIYDGKSQPVLFITGSNKTSTFSGPLVTTTISASSNANLRTTKANLNLQVNVKDYGALGDGTTDDTAAINAAAVAVVSHGTLYFPPGKYRITAGITAFDSVTYVTITGTGAEIYNDSGASGANTFVVNNTCSNFEICNLKFTGTATVRGSGIHIRMGASYSNIHDCSFHGCSDFGVLVSYGAGGWIYNCKVSNCLAYTTLGDGFHFGSVVDSTIENCTAISTGDDGLGIVADTLANAPNRIEVVGFTSYQAGNPAEGGTHGCGIRIADGAVDIHIVGGSSYGSAEAGLYLGRAASTTVYNTRVVVDGFKVVAPIQVAGMLGGINCTFTNQAEFHGCRVEAPVTGCGFSFLDCNNLVVTGCTVKDAALRSFAVDDGTTTNVATNWSNWTISGNVSLGTPTNEIYYFTPASGKTLTNLLITGNTETGCSATNYIFTNRLAGTCKIITNTSLGGKAIANGGSGIVPTATPNY